MLIDQEALFSFLSAFPEGILVIDSAGKIIFANPSCGQLYGLKPTDLVGQASKDFIPENLVISKKQIKEMFKLRQGQAVDVNQKELAILRSDGSMLPVYISITPVESSAGPLLLLAIAEMADRRRIEMELRKSEAELKKSEAELRSNEAALEQRVRERTEALEVTVSTLRQRENELLRLSRALESSPVSVAIFGQGGVVEYANTSFEKMVDRPAGELIGMDSVRLYAGKQESDLLRAIHEAVLSGRPWKGELPNFVKDGQVVWYAASVSPVHSDNGKISNFLFIAEDITERRRVSEELRHAKEEAESANRAKSEFLANMSHEIRTPMNAITGLTHLVLQTDLDDVQSGYVNKIQSSAQGLLRVINDILDFSRVEAGKLIIETVDFNLDQVLENLSVLISLKAQEKGIELLFSRAHSVPSALVGDPSRLLQVLTNLVNNAIKFTEKGEVVITTEMVRKASPRGTGPLGTGRVVLKFTVRDSGIGMTPEQVTRLFQPFSQADSSTSRKYGGTGLGLAISRQLVNLMGGEIMVDSELGVGSTFSFTAEFGTRSQPAADELLQTQLLNELLHGLKVLVVDDNLHARDILEQYLEFYTRSVSVASSGLEAIAELERARSDDPYGLLILDQEMPGLDGIRVLRSIRDKQRYANLPVILMLPSYADNDAPDPRVENSSGPAGKEMANALLYKPVNPSRLYDALVEVLSRRAIEQAQGGAVLNLAASSPAKAKDEKPSIEDPNQMPAWATTLTPLQQLKKGVQNKQTGPVRAHGEDPLLRLHGARLLLVEDNQVNLDMTRRLLESSGFIVTAVSSGGQALSVLENQNFDGVLMDIHMPLMDGLETTRMIRMQARFAHLPIIALTANVFDDMRRKCIEVGMNGFVGKPVNVQELFATLQQCIPPVVSVGDSISLPSAESAAAQPAASEAEADSSGARSKIPAAPSQDVVGMIHDLRGFLEENDTRAVRVVAGLKQRIPDQDIQIELAVLEKLISRYNYDAAAKMLGPIAEKLRVPWKPIIKT